MKVVLFCGGLGTRLRDYSDAVPKPLVTVGYRPILWHVMKYYAYFGHTDFILCLGYKADMIKEYFLTYNECVSNDFTFSNGGRSVSLLQSDIQDWNITFVDTGMYSSIGERLRRVRPYLEGEEVFMANYSDGLTDLHLPDLTGFAAAHGKTATFVAVQARQSFHVISLGHDHHVSRIRPASDCKIWINGGYFVFNANIWRFIRGCDDLITEVFPRLIQDKELVAYPYSGFWCPMDTFKEREELESMWVMDNCPWRLWNRRPAMAAS